MSQVCLVKINIDGHLQLAGGIDTRRETLNGAIHCISIADPYKDACAIVRFPYASTQFHRTTRQSSLHPWTSRL